jgi:hypothetical protein
MHITFCALRDGERKPDVNTRGTRLREVSKLPLDEYGYPSKDDTEEYFYEATTSICVIGVDEWVWSVYCCVDTYFGEENWTEYLNTSPGVKDETDAPSGGWIRQINPYWNPREYFLIVLHRRMIQATTEWSVLITNFAERLDIYVRESPSLCLEEAENRTGKSH